MTLPLVLIIDDQYGCDSALRKKLQKDAGLLGGEGVTELNAVAEAVFCSGQIRTDAEAKNDYGVIRQTIESASAGSATWALILLDACFDSGKIKHGEPSGLPGDDTFGMTVRDKLMSEFPGLPIVMLTGKHESELSGEQHPYLSKTRMTSRIFSQHLIKHGRLTLDQQRILLGLTELGIVACSPLSFKLFHDADCINDNVSILILGESGTGKEKLVEYLYKRSNRKDKPFIGINVAAIPADLVESELFGHEKGSFTGAVARQLGKFESADGGTLFLDEIGDMPLDIQAKVLRVLQEKKMQRIGGTELISVNVRILSATSRDIGELLANGKFREDLLFRIGGTNFTVPPLRARREDILPLAEKFLKELSSDNNLTGILLGDGAKVVLSQHPFFGNVRELENIINHLLGTIGNNRVISGVEMQDALNKSISRLLKRSNLPEQTPPILSTEETIINAVPVSSSSINSLNDLLITINEFKVSKDDPDLAGAVGKFDEASNVLLKKLVGASLEIFRNQNTNKLNKQGAMKFLTGNNAIKTSDPKRVINRILGKKSNYQPSDVDIENLVRYWWETSK